MEIKGSRLSSSQLKKLLDFFVAGVTSRTAAELVGIHRNSVNLFYHKLRTIIAYFSDLESPFCMAKSKWMGPISAESAKANAVAVPQVRFL